MKKKKKSIFDQMMENENFRKKYDEEKHFFEIEYQLARIMQENGVSQKDLAQRLGVDKSVVSKDLAGALKKAGVKKLQTIAEALDCEFVTLFVPKNLKKKVEKQVMNYLFTVLKRA